MKISVLTLGCRINQAESLDIEQTAQRSGHQLVDLSEKPDICVINTCAVTAKANNQSRQLLNKAVKLSKKVILTGCYVDINKDLLKNMTTDVLEVVGNDAKSSICGMIPFTGSSPSEDLIPTKCRPVIKVQDGCNYSCSYCVVPLARGKSRSVPADEIVSQIRTYESLDRHEVVLSGIHLGTYGFDLKPRNSLAKLIKYILKNTAISRIRLSSLEIREIDDELLELLTEERLCDHLHIPLQSGDDRILNSMNRTYTAREFMAGIEKILSVKPGIGLGTDVIVGFPGEGVKEFGSTRSFIDSIPFSYLHVFPYSPRPLTRALTFPEHVSGPVKRERVSLLRELGQMKKRDYIRNHIGKTLDIIVEGADDRSVTGTTRNYIKVLAEDDRAAKVGTLIHIGISGYKTGAATGIPINYPEPTDK